MQFMDVSSVAHMFNGGGHAAASGAMVTGSLEEVTQKVIDTTYKTLAEKLEHAYHILE